jgi:putative PIN family toxin of toxin-antitoxin system
VSQAPEASLTRVVLDTNIVLDLWLYKDSATPALRDELERVLAYTHIVKRLAFSQLTAQDILAQFDAHAQLMPIATKCQFVCKDGDDQKFIDLAAEQKTQLISKDKAVLTMRNRMARLGVAVGKTFPALLPA